VDLLTAIYILQYDTMHVLIVRHVDHLGFELTCRTFDVAATMSTRRETCNHYESHRKCCFEVDSLRILSNIQEGQLNIAICIGCVNLISVFLNCFCSVHFSGTCIE